MLRNIFSRILSHPWWVVLAATTTTTLASDLAAGVIAFVLTALPLLIARRLMQPVELPASDRPSGEEGLFDEMGRKKYAPACSWWVGNIYHRSHMDD